MATPKKINEPAGTNFETALLDLFGAPHTAQNYQFLNAWATREHGSSFPKSLYANNPFFTTAGGGGSAGPVKAHTYPLIPDSAFPGGKNTAGVPAYPDVTSGTLATAFTLGQYPGIVGALKSGSPQQYATNPEFEKELSTWSGSGYSSLNAAGQPGTPEGPGLNVPIEGVSASDFWSGKGGALVAGGALGVGAIAGGVTASSILGLGGGAAAGAEAAGAGAGAGGGAGLLSKLLGGAAGKTGFAVFLAYMAEKYGKDWIIRGAEIVGGGVLILLGFVMIALGSNGSPQAQTVRAVKTVAR